MNDPKYLLQNQITIFVVAGLCAAAQFVLFSTSACADTVALAFGQSAFRLDSQTTFGWSFILSVPVTVTNLGYFDSSSDGLGDAHAIAIWTSAGGVPLLSGTVPAGTSATLLGGFRYVAISPLLLAPGTYTIGGYSPGLNDSVAIVASDITTAPGVTYNGSRSAQGAGFTFPAGDTQGYVNGDLGPNFQFTVPEPSTVAVLLLGGGGLLVCWKRRTSRNIE